MTLFHRLFELQFDQEIEIKIPKNAKIVDVSPIDNFPNFLLTFLFEEKEECSYQSIFCMLKSFYHGGRLQQSSVQIPENIIFCKNVMYQLCSYKATTNNRDVETFNFVSIPETHHATFLAFKKSQEILKKKQESPFET